MMRGGMWVMSSALAALSSCTGAPARPEVRERVMVSSSFENILGFAEQVPPSLTTEKAHTGRYAVRVDAQNQYSLTYHGTLGQLCTTKPRKFIFSAWVWVPRPEDEATLILALTSPDDPEHPLLHKNVYLTDRGPYGKWKQVRREIDVPGTVNRNTRLALYLWNGTAQQPVYADDWQLAELK